MKLLLDENLPTKLKGFFSEGHQLFTVKDMKWQGKKNGELLGLLTFNGFDAFITVDKNLKYQQNLGKFRIKIFILNASDNKLTTLEPFVPLIEKSLENSSPNNFIELSIEA